MWYDACRQPAYQPVDLLLKVNRAGIGSLTGDPFGVLLRRFRGILSPAIVDVEAKEWNG